MKYVYDAIIIGAGPAGLSLASELSKKHDILVIEKGKIGETTKCWTTEERLMRKLKLEKFISVKFDRSYIASNEKNKFTVYNKYVSVAERELLVHFAGIVRKNEGTIIERCEFLSFKRERSIKVATSKGTFFCDLIIDCSGYGSKLAKKYLDKPLFYFPIYGKIYKRKLSPENIALLDVGLRVTPLIYTEAFPITNNSFVFYTFSYVAKDKGTSNYKKLHEKNLKMSGLDGAKAIREVNGVVPMGITKKHTADNIIFFGDNVLLAAPVAGTGFTAILTHYKKFAKHISSNIDDGQLSARELEYHYSDGEALNREAQATLGVILANMKPETIDLLIGAMKNFPRKTINDCVWRFSITPKQVGHVVKALVEGIGVRRLMSFLPKDQRKFITREAMKIIEDIAEEEADEILRIHKDSV